MMMHNLPLLVDAPQPQLVRRMWFASPNASSWYGDLPPGVTSNFVNPVSDAYQLIIINVICILLCVLLIGARLYSKTRVTHNLGWDDYTCVIGFVFAVFYAVTCLELGSYGAGRHVWDQPHAWLETYLLWAFLGNFYWFSVAASKSSFLLLYLRIFGNNKSFKWFTWAMLFFVNGLCLACFLAVTFICDPVDGAWAPVSGNLVCHDNKRITLAAAALGLLQDLIILIMPMPLVHTLHIPQKQRIAVLGLFLTGVIATVVTAVRLSILVNVANSKSEDYTWIDFPIYTWSTAELYVFVMVACLPLTKTFARKIFPRIFERSHASSTDKSSSRDYSLRKFHPRNWSRNPRSEPRDSPSQSDLMSRPEKAHVAGSTNQSSAGPGTVPWTEPQPAPGCEVKSHNPWVEPGGLVGPDREAGPTDAFAAPSAV